MATLVKQSTKAPTRKMWAVIISGVIMGAAQSLLTTYWPDHPFAPYMADANIWLQSAVMVAAGYFVKERAQ